MMPIEAHEPLDHHEEAMNALTHGVGFVLSLFGAVAMVSAARQLGIDRVIACSVYLTTLVAVYAVSTLSHIVRDPTRKHALRVFDQGVIYLLIAGTYTPLLWTFLSSNQRWAALALVWLAAVTGKYLKLVAQHRVVDFSTQTYLWLGWLPALMLFRFVPRECLAWIVLGGIAYTVGTLFLMRDRQYRYFHAIWHVLVILGSACHFYSIYAFVVLP
jgi:hemolysin III